MSFLEDVEKKLDLSSAEKRQVINELTSHFEDLKEELLASGMTELEAEREAEKRMGEPSDVAQRMIAIHCTASWKTALMAALPFVLVAVARILLRPYMLSRGYHMHAANRIGLLFQGDLIFMAACLPLVIGCVREFRAGRRPLWLPTWLALGGSVVFSLFNSSLLLALNPKAPIVSQSLGFSWALELLLVGGITVYLYRESRKTWVIALSVVALLAPCIYYFIVGSTELPLLLMYMGILQIPLMTALAVKVFARHPYGSLVQASMFLYAFYGGLMPMTMPSTSWGWAVMLITKALALAVGIIACARICSDAGKIKALSLGIISAVIIVSMAPALGHSVSILYYLRSYTSVILISIVLTVVAPLLFEKLSRIQRFRVVR